MKVQYHVSSSDLTDVEDVGGWVKNFTDSELDSDKQQGTTSGLRWWYERLRCRVMAACMATPSHKKTYPSGCASGYFTDSVLDRMPELGKGRNFPPGLVQYLETRQKRIDVTFEVAVEIPITMSSNRCSNYISTSIIIMRGED